MGVRWMAAWVLTLLAAMPASAGDVSAERAFFAPCADALRTPQFAALRPVIPEALPDNAGCMHLTDREFLLYANPGAPGNPFLYCDLRVAAPKCEPESAFSPYSFEIERVFTGGAGKRFMLWSTFHLKRGRYSSGYGIFSLVPESQAPRGYAIYGLPVGDLRSMLEGDDSQPCNQLGEKAAKKVSGVTVNREGTKDVELVFLSEVTDCASGAATPLQESFRVVGGRVVPATPP